MSNIKDDALLSACHLNIYIPDGPVVSGYHQTASCEDKTFFFLGSCSITLIWHPNQTDWGATRFQLPPSAPPPTLTSASLTVSSTDRQHAVLAAHVATMMRRLMNAQRRGQATVAKAEAEG